MTTTSHRIHPAWADRFRTPGPDDLIEGIDKQLRPAAHRARELLLRDRSVREQVIWQGVWKWTLTYRQSLAPERAWAYIIPEPSRPRLCVPMPESALHELSVQKTARFVREALAFAPIVDHTRWPVWEFQTRQQAEEILTILSAKLDAAAVGGGEAK